MRDNLGSRVNRSCMDNVFTLVQGRLRENKHTYAFLLDVQKAYDTVWRELMLWDLGVKGRIWHVISVSRSALLLEVNYV